MHKYIVKNSRENDFMYTVFPHLNAVVFHFNFNPLLPTTLTIPNIFPSF